MAALLLCMVVETLQANETTVTTRYINKHFEVRDHDAPTKYVLNGETRVARVTGSLKDNLRIQRLRVRPGWNLCSIAVTATNALNQLSTLARQLIEAAYNWTPAITNWKLVAANDTLPAGTVLWLNATTNATLGFAGAYPGLVPSLRAPPEGAFLPGVGLEVFPTTNLSLTVTAAAFDTPGRGWSSTYSSLLLVANLQSVLAPGQGFHAQAPVPTDLLLPDPALSLRLYHQDHLGSTSCLTDAQGNLVEEAANHPFGHARLQHQPKGLHEAYQFSKKEQDLESGNYLF